MKKIFVSGCYDIIHAGHLQFFKEARALGDHLTVSFASEEVLWHHKQRRSSIPDEHKRAVLLGLSMVDQVVIGTDHNLGLDFRSHFLQIKPDILAVTEDDQYETIKRELCAQTGATYHVLAKSPPEFEPVSTSSILRWVRAPAMSPVRVDFAGGWLDVPRHARAGAYIVNCAVTPGVSLRDWSYQKRAGLGGSGAWALLNGDDGVGAELDLGVGWQDPAVIRETGLCVWRSGPGPVLDFKRNGEVLAGRLALYWTGQEHDTPGLADAARDYDAIEAAGKIARDAVLADDLAGLAEAVDRSYRIQLAEGMAELPGVDGAMSKKYCGGGFGGYGCYLFETSAQRDLAAQLPEWRAIEPYCR